MGHMVCYNKHSESFVMCGMIMIERDIGSLALTVDQMVKRLWLMTQKL